MLEKVLGLLTNIRLGWKGLLGTNVLAHFTLLGATKNATKQ